MEEWSRDYQDLVQRAKRTGAEPIVMTVLPVERNRPLGDKCFNARQIKLINKEIRRIAAAEDVTLAEGFEVLSNGEGYGEKGSTVDGVHLTTDSYKKWKQLIMDSVAGAMERRGAYCQS